MLLFDWWCFIFFGIPLTLLSIISALFVLAKVTQSRDITSWFCPAPMLIGSPIAQVLSADEARLSFKNETKCGEDSLLGYINTACPPLSPNPLTPHAFTSARHCRRSDTFLVLLSKTEQTGKHMRSTIEFSQPTSVYAVIVPVSHGGKTTTKAEERGSVPVECGCLVHFFQWLETCNVCVFCFCFFCFGSLNKQLQKATLHLPTLELSIQNGTKR